MGSRTGSASPSDENNEKGVAQIRHHEGIHDPDAGLSDAERAAIDKKLLRKLDMKLIPWLTLLYLVSFLDRTNIGNAKIDGLLDDLKMSGPQYNASLSIFFVSYALFEPLTNVLLKRLKPSIFIPAIMVAWGIVMTLMGVVHNFEGLAAARFFLGVAEAGLFPGVNYYLSCWYKRSEIGKRVCIFCFIARVIKMTLEVLTCMINSQPSSSAPLPWLDPSEACSPPPLRR
jgi:sugar phosphate permease